MAFNGYASETIEQKRRQEAYRVYVTDSLKLQGESKYLTKRYIDLFEPRREIDVQAVIEHVVKAGGLEVIG